MIKQAVIIKLEDKPVMVLPITTFQSAEDYAKFELECKKNFEECGSEKELKYLTMLSRIEDLQEEIKILKTELKYQKGEITEEEYQKLIGEGE